MIRGAYLSPRLLLVRAILDRLRKNPVQSGWSARLRPASSLGDLAGVREIYLGCYVREFFRRSAVARDAEFFARPFQQMIGLELPGDQMITRR
jgi:hypothetical protein